MQLQKINNPHCGKPKILKDGSRWSIFFKYKKEGEDKWFPMKRDLDLNSNEYLKKIKGKVTEINKSDRIQYAALLLHRVQDELNLKHFNPHTKTFETLDKSSNPFVEFLDAYIDYTPNKQRKQSTKDIYRSYNNIIKEYLASISSSNISLNQVNKEIISNFLNGIDTSKSTTQRDNYLVYLKGVFKYCVDEDVIAKNPLRQLRTINNQTSTTNKAYPKELVVQVLATAKNYDIYFWLLLRMIYYTLRRPDELLQLQYKDFDFEKGTVTFSSNKIKTNKPMYSVLPDILLDDIKTLLVNVSNKNSYFLGSSNSPENSERRKKDLFAEYKTPFYHFQDKFKVLRKRLGLEEGYTIYSFKHTGVVYLVEIQKLDDKEIIETTGHSNPAILGRYSRDAKRERIPHTGTL